MKLFAIEILGIIIFSIPTVAQEIQNIPRLDDNIERGLDQNLDFQILEKLVPPSLESQPRTSLPASVVQITEFRIKGNTAIPDEKLQLKLKSYLGKEIIEEDIIEIENTLTNYYADRGFLEVGAFVTVIESDSKKESNQATVEIQIFERVLSNIQISGAKCLAPFVRKRLRKYIDKPFNSNDFTNEIQFLLEKVTIEQIQVEFLATEIVNESKIEIDIVLGRTKELAVTLNNQRSPSVGELERGLEFTHRNLTCRGDRLNLLYRNTDGSNVAEARYEIPVNADDGTVSVSAFFGRADTVREPISEFDLDSETLRFSTAFRQPVMRRSNETKIEETIVGIRASYLNSRETFADVGFPLSAGRDLDGEFRSTVLTPFIEYSRKANKTVLALRSEIDFGLPIGAVNDPFFGDGSFVKGKLQGLLLYRLNNRLALSSRLKGQIANRSLSSSEQFFLGGPNAVRNADTNLSLDSGITFSQELRTLLFQSGQHQLEIAPFVDVGYAANRSPLIFQDNLTLVSLGFALRANLFDNRVQATIVYGQPILGRESFQDGSDIKFTVKTRIF